MIAGFELIISPNFITLMPQWVYFFEKKIPIRSDSGSVGSTRIKKTVRVKTMADTNVIATVDKHPALLAMVLDLDAKCFDSSSESSSDGESSDDDGVYILLGLVGIGGGGGGVKRKKARCEGYVDDVVSQYSQKEFRSHFRMSRSTFDVILGECSACYSEINICIDICIIHTHSGNYNRHHCEPNNQFDQFYICIATDVQYSNSNVVLHLQVTFVFKN